MTAGSALGALLDEAGRKLSSSELGSEAGFHSLPAVFVIGPEGSAKTTLVVNSGLDPELLAGQVFQEDHIVSTGLVNVWYAGQTVFVEPGPSLRADQNLWMELLQRMRSPVGAPRAAIVCFGCDNFSKPGAVEAAGEAARHLRAKLNEISKTLGVALPVYVLFSKADRTPFFLEFARHLDDREAGQVVGETLRLTPTAPGAYAELETARLGKAFQDLVYSLCDKRPEFLARETDGAALGPVYEFPREFRKMRVPLVQFLLELCRPSQLQPAPFLRGFYFCGVRQIVIQEQLPAPSRGVEPEAVDPGATRAFRLEEMTGVHPAAGVPRFAARRVPQWTFLSGFFSNVLLQDSAGLGAVAVRPKSNVLGRLCLAAAVAACLLLAIAITVSFVRNQALLHEIRDGANAIDLDGDRVNPASLGTLKRLEALRTVVVRLAKDNRQGAPWTMGWGLYAGSNAYPEARRLYFDRFKNLLFNEVQGDLAGELKSLPATPGASDEYAHTYDTLKGWLEITSHHRDATLSFLPPLLENRWVRGRNIDSESRRLARAQFDFYTAELINASPFPADEQRDVVERARKYLVQFGGAMRVYKSMLAEVNRANPPLNFNQGMPGSADIVVNTREVASGFTNPGYGLMSLAMKNSAKYAGGEEWVLGKQAAAPGDQPAVDPKIQEMYYAEYVEQWRDYLKNSAVVRYTNIKDAVKKLATTSSPQSPLLALLWLAARNTAVDAPAIQKAFVPLHALMPPETGADTGAQHMGTPTAAYLASLATLKDVLEQASTASAAQSEALAEKVRDTAIAARLAARKTVEALGVDKDAHIETLVAKLLEDPISYAEAVSPMGPDVGPLNSAGAALCKQFQKVLSKKPFQPNAHESASLEDINAIFRPQEGALWTFYDAHLKNLLVKSGTDYSTGPKTRTALTPAFLHFFNQATQFSDALYAGEAGPAISFALKPAFGEDLQSVTLTIDEQSATFAPNAPSKQFTWPGNGVRMVAKGATEYSFAYDGLWGVFDFFNDADKPPPSPEWTVRSGRQGKALLVVHFELDMLGKPPMFQRGYFQNLACVAEVAKR